MHDRDPGLGHLAVHRDGAREAFFHQPAHERIQVAAPAPLLCLREGGLLRSERSCGSPDTLVLEGEAQAAARLQGDGDLFTAGGSSRYFSVDTEQFFFIVDERMNALVVRCDQEMM